MASRARDVGRPLCQVVSSYPDIAAVAHEIRPHFVQDFFDIFQSQVERAVVVRALLIIFIIHLRLQWWQSASVLIEIVGALRQAYI